MPREARFFNACSGSAMRGFLKLRGNITPRWIKNARISRKRVEPGIEESLRKLRLLRKRHPRARTAIRNLEAELKALLLRWETAYRKENFYRGIRVLLEIQRNGSSKL
jgi:hypothetical protein